MDFIFGGANAVFDNCEIKSIDRVGINPKGYIVAPSTLDDNKGFLIQNSKLTSNIEEKESIYLGRSWHPTSAKTPVNSTAIYKNCEMGAHIKTEGWTEMSCAGVMIQPLDNRIYEYGSTGEGARTSDTRRVLTDEQASQYTIENILSGWDVSQKKAELELYKENVVTTPDVNYPVVSKKMKLKVWFVIQLDLELQHQKKIIKYK